MNFKEIAEKLPTFKSLPDEGKYRTTNIKLKKDNIVLPWVAKIKNEIESMGHEKYVEDVDKFFKDLKKYGVEKVYYLRI